MSKKKIHFVKMAGAGNDFLVLEDAAGLQFKKLARIMCHRTNGVGADGLLILAKSKKADYRMRIINADGSEAEMCGNGARCLAAYIARNKKGTAKNFSVETKAGNIIAQARGEVAEIRLSDPRGYRPDIPLKILRKPLSVHYIDTGVPHTIIYVDNLKNINVREIAPYVRYHKKFFPRGTNVNFVEQINTRLIDARTYERGVEAETKACGTGSVAAALVTFLKSHPEKTEYPGARMNVRTQSGEVLHITFDIIKGKPQNVRLKGSACFIAEGYFFL